MFIQSRAPKPSTPWGASWGGLLQRPCPLSSTAFPTRTPAATALRSCSASAGRAGAWDSLGRHIMGPVNTDLRPWGGRSAWGPSTLQQAKHHRSASLVASAKTKPELAEPEGGWPTAVPVFVPCIGQPGSKLTGVMDVSHYVRAKLGGQGSMQFEACINDIQEEDESTGKVLQTYPGPMRPGKFMVTAGHPDLHTKNMAHLKIADPVGTILRPGCTFTAYWGVLSGGAKLRVRTPAAQQKQELATQLPEVRQKPASSPPPPEEGWPEAMPIQTVAVPRSSIVHRGVLHLAAALNQVGFPDGTISYKWTTQSPKLVTDVVKVDTDTGEQTPVEDQPAGGYTVGRFLWLGPLKRDGTALEKVEVLPPGEEDWVILEEYLKQHGVDTTGKGRPGAAKA